MTALALLLSLTTPAEAAEIVAFGDDWIARDAGTVLDTTLDRLGLSTLDVDSDGVAGRTAADVVDDGSLDLIAAVDRNPDAEWVWISLLMEDTLDHHQAGRGAVSAALNEANARQLLDDLFVAHPDIKVLVTGYEHTAWMASPACAAQAQAALPDLFLAGTPTLADLHAVLVREIDVVWQGIALDDPRVTHVPVAGTLQARAGQPVSPATPSPTTAMLGDCRTPTPTSFVHLAEALAPETWDHPVPTVQLGVPAQVDGCVGEVAALSPVLVDHDEVWWRLDLTEVSRSPAYQPTFLPGTHLLELEARGGLWYSRAFTRLNGRSAPELTVEPAEATVCPDTETTLRAFSDGDVTWAPVDAVSPIEGSIVRVRADEDTTITATASRGGCSVEATIPLRVVSVPDLAVAGPPTLAPGGSGTYSAAGVQPDADVRWYVDGVLLGTGVQLVWTMPESGPTVIVEVRTTTPEGCELSAFTQVSADFPEPETVGGGTAGPSSTGCACASIGAGPGGALPFLGALGLLAVGRRRGRGAGSRPQRA